MPIINKTKRTAAIYNRGREVVKVYDHGKLAWQKSIPDYLCFTALEAGTFTLTIPAAVTSTYLSYVEYSLDGRNWTRLTVDSTAQSITTPNVAAGDKVYWRGSGACMTATSTTAGRQSIFSSTARFDVSGYIMSLLKGDNFASYTHLTNYSTDGVRNMTFARLFEGCTTLVGASSLVLPTFTSWHTYIFSNLFAGCTSLTTAPELPSTSMATSCYNSMFYGCTSLTATPTLPATNLAADCYYYMFCGCTNLVTATSLPATILASNCYHSMFVNCTSLETGFVLPATILANSSYYQMFFGCTNLKYVKCLATDISATNCLTNWLYNVSSTGTFIQASSVTWPRGASGIPTGWVDIEKRTMPQGYKQVEYVANPNKPSDIPMPIVDTGIVYNPLDTFEVGCKPKLDENGYINEMAFANGSSYATYIGNFFLLHRITSSTNLLQISENIGDNNATSAYSNNKIAETPQYIKVENTPTSLSLYLNGALLQTKSPITIDPETGQKSTIAAKLFGYNSIAYNWSGGIYYFKWWRNGVLIVDYVACVRESDNEPSFYDFVSNTFKVPTRTGFFTAGQEI